MNGIGQATLPKLGHHDKFYRASKGKLALLH